MSPTRFRQTFQEAVEGLPNESRMMLGGGTRHAEKAFGAIGDAECLAVNILQKDARDFFMLG